MKNAKGKMQHQAAARPEQRLRVELRVQFAVCNAADLCRGALG
jgi:hypothetical protein